ncbi:MAG: HAMP domain-containing sensor histidine kinase [Candidatus Gracilibacteria bacterium]|nr:HAMP domain-containing sensor histidine kinase [Candidatus Gracilibacteria bacterium]
MKKKIKLGLASKVAIKVTIISLVLFYSTITLVMVVQYSLLKDALFEDFSRYAALYMESLLDSNIIDDDLEAKISENASFFSFLPFDTSGNRLSDAIIRNNETGKIIVNEYQYIPEDSQNEMFDIPEATPVSKEVGDRFYFLYKITYKKYSILYASLTSSISEYYGLLLYRLDVILWASILIFFAMGFYFSRLVIKPIQDHNTSLKLYNTNLAHELKTPLSVVRSNLDMLELTKNEKFIASSKEELTHIENIINSLLFLIQKRSSGEYYEIKNLANIIKKSSEKFPQLSVNFENFETEIQKEINEDLFILLVENIFENAHKYSSDEKISVSLNEKFLKFGNQVERNLSTKELKQIEEIFYQVDNSRNSQGYGLGIPMIKKIIENFGWEMKISCKNNIFEIKIIF